MSQSSLLTRSVLIALFAGLALGLLVFQLTDIFSEAIWVESVNRIVVDGILKVGGEIFIAFLKVLVVPLVFFSLVCGVCGSGSGENMSRLGLRTFGLYVVTTALAITIALLLASVIDPGASTDLQTEAVTFEASEPPTLYETFKRIFPTNIIQSMAAADMLPIICFSILFGLALLKAGEAGSKIRSTFENMNAVMLVMVSLVMRLAPIGVFCLVAQVFAEKGIGFVLPLMTYFVTVILALLLHAVFVYGGFLALFARVNPIHFLKVIMPACLFGFSTASSAATMPITMRILEKVVGVKNSVVSFTVPLGATLNMDGTAIMQGVATVFIASVYQVDLTLVDYLMVILTATLASVGTAAVPGAGMITLSMVLIQIGLPVEAIGLILGVDRLLDMCRTAVNILGDATVTLVVAKQGNQLDEHIFNKRGVAKV